MNEPGPKVNAEPPPKAVVQRLSLYLRELQHLLREGKETTSSTELGGVLGLSDAQVRKDLAYFGQFGYPGVGYRCGELSQKIKAILGTDQGWPVAIVGMGNLGQALLGYGGFANQSFHVTVAFDIDPQKTGRRMHGIEVFHLDQMQEVVQRRGIRLAILAVPATAAPDAAKVVVESGIEGILNFSPVALSLPPSIKLVGVDLAVELEQLAYAVVNSAQKN